MFMQSESPLPITSPTAAVRLHNVSENYNAISIMTKTLTDVQRPAFPPLIANLMISVSNYEKQKAEENTDNHLPPRQAAQARAIRQAIVRWLVENGPATAAEVAERFQYHQTTAHSYLNRIVHDGQARLVIRKNDLTKRDQRVFIVEKS